jgi:hypothetical protein
MIGFDFGVARRNLSFVRGSPVPPVRRTGWIDHWLHAFPGKFIQSYNFHRREILLSLFHFPVKSLKNLSE